MAMSDDYLWDRSGTPDPDVERLEALLGRLRSTPGVPELPHEVRLKADPTIPERTWRSAVLARRSREAAEAAAGPTEVWSVRSVAPLLAAAAMIALMIGATWRSTRGGGAWDVARVDGRPLIGSTALADTGRIAVGQTLVTDATSRARIDVSTIGKVTVDPDSRVRLVATREAHHQLALDRGTLHVSITAPPGQFIVDTPSARATDLGCAYTLHVDEDGAGLISVTAGWVAFERDGVESFVPAGASCRTRRGRGPGTPKYDTESQEYRDAVLRADKAALDRWWDALGLGDTAWWRTWRRPMN